MRQDRESYSCQGRVESRKTSEGIFRGSSFLMILELMRKKKKKKPRLEFSNSWHKPKHPSNILCQTIYKGHAVSHKVRHKKMTVLFSDLISMVDNRRVCSSPQRTVVPGFMGNGGKSVSGYREVAC